MAFIGSADEYEEYKKTEKTSNVIEGQGNLISYDDMPDMSEEDAKLLKQIRIHNDPYMVWMQSDAEFYDEFYNREEKHELFDKEFMEEVKSIRRIYKDLDKFQYALAIRDEYFDKLIDKYGGEERFIQYANAGLVKEWIPPLPMLSTNCPDYIYYKEGRVRPINDWDDEAVEEIMGQIMKEFAENNDLSQIGIKGDVVTDPMILADIEARQFHDARNESRIRQSANSFNGVSMMDLDGLKKELASWMTEDEKTEERDSDNTTGETILSAY